MIRHEIISMYEGEIIEQYCVYDDYVMLLWLYDGVDECDEYKKVLIAKLTSEEHQLLVQRNRAKEGILEPIRKNLTHKEVILMELSRNDSRKNSVRITVPSDGDEEHFLDTIDNALINVSDGEK